MYSFDITNERPNYVYSHNKDMTLRGYLTLMIIATLLCAVIFGITLSVVDPSTTNWLGFTLFYSSLFLTVLGVAALLGFIIRFVALKKDLAVRAVIISFRQAFLASLVVVVALLLLAQQLFSWLSVLLLVLGFSTLEFFLISLSSEER